MKKPSVVFLLLALLASAGLIAGCSGLRHYPNAEKKNLFVDKKTERGVRTSLHVYKVDSDCEASYEGTVFLKKVHSDVGIPAGRLSYLVFNFARSSFLYGKSSTSIGTLLTPRSGKVYKAEVVYEDDLYNVEIFEAESAKAKGKEVEMKDLGECKPAK